MGGQGRAECLQPLPQLGLEVTGDGDHGGSRCSLPKLLDELELPVWIQGGLQDNHVAGLPETVDRIRSLDRLGGDAEPPGRGPRPLGEQQIVLHHKETPWHGSRITG